MKRAGRNTANKSSFKNTTRMPSLDKIQQVFRKGLLFAVLLCAILSILYIVICGFYVLSRRYNDPLSVTNSVFIEQKSLRTVVVIVESSSSSKILGAWVVTDNPENTSLMQYYIPPGVYIPDYYSKIGGLIQIENLDYAGQLVSKTRSHEYVVREIIDASGISATNYIWLNTESVKSYNTLFSDVTEYSYADYASKYSGEVSNASLQLNALIDKVSFSKMVINPMTAKSLLSSIETNMSGYELGGYIGKIKALMGTNSKKMIDLSQSWAVTEYYDQQYGRNIPIVNVVAVDKKVEQGIEDLRPEDILKEMAKIEIYNGSDIAGLGQRYYRRITNSGLNVARFDNSPTQYEKTTIYVPKEERFNVSLSLIKEILKGDYVIVNSRPDFITTGDIIVVLGQDRSKYVTWKD